MADSAAAALPVAGASRRPGGGPAYIVDAHHHFLAPDRPYHKFLGTLGAPVYTAEQYRADCGDLPVAKSVHVEAMPDDPLGEVAAVEEAANAGRCNVAAIIANCDLAADDAAERLDELQAASPRLRGIRMILDYDGKFDGNKTNCTHPARMLDDTDYLRDPAASKRFERGFASLAARGLSFDLQCAPCQMGAALAMMERHPKVAVCIDHLGKLFRLKADGGEEDAAKLAEWSGAMAKLAALPQTYVKLSMLGCVCPGWAGEAKKEELVRGLVREVIRLFGARRCMFASNWHINGAVSNADGGDDVDISMPELYARFASWVSDYSEEDQAWLFAKSAEALYRL